MKRFQSKCGVGVLAISLTVGLGAPGCHQIGAFLLKLIFEIAGEVAASKIGPWLEKKLDAWVFDKASPENQGGDVVADSSNGLSGRYNGQMEITVKKEDGNNSSTKVSNPRMVRDSTSAKWKLAPDIIRTARERTEESFLPAGSY